MSIGKRYRRPVLKDGELRVYFGRLPHENPDIIFSWQGDHCMKRDSNLLYYHFSCKRPTVSLNGADWSNMEPSLIEELDRRGYDITTLKFSIQKKVLTPSES